MKGRLSFLCQHKYCNLIVLYLRNCCMCEFFCLHNCCKYVSFCPHNYCIYVCLCLHNLYMLPFSHYNRDYIPVHHNLCSCNILGRHSLCNCIFLLRRNWCSYTNQCRCNLYKLSLQLLHRHHYNRGMSPIGIAFVLLPEHC